MKGEEEEEAPTAALLEEDVFQQICSGFLTVHNQRWRTTSENQKTVVDETEKMALMQNVLIKVWWSYAP